MSEYPKYLYGVEGQKLVLNREQESALGDGWFDSPAKVQMPKEEADPAIVLHTQGFTPARISAHAVDPVEEPLEEIESEATAFFTLEKSELIAECVRHGIEVDKRWGVKKLQEVLASK